MKEKFKGVGPAMVTPLMENGDIDFDGLKTLTESLIDGGVDYLVVQGTTGESPTLSKWEKAAPNINPGNIVATIFHSLGLDLESHLPGPAGRPFPLVDFGKHEIHELF